MSYVFIWFMFGLVATIIANTKGRSGCGWFLLGMLLGPFALVIAFLPSMEQKEIQITQHGGKSGDFKRCEYCAEVVRKEAIKCRYCGSSLSVVSSSDENINDTVAYYAGRAVAKLGIKMPKMEYHITENIAYFIGKTLGRLPLWARLLVVLLVILLLIVAYGWMRKPSNSYRQPTPTTASPLPTAQGNTVKPQAAPISYCDAAKAQFLAYERFSGESYINCVANINAPPGCGETTLQHMLDQAKSR